MLSLFGQNSFDRRAGDKALIQKVWASVQRAIAWIIANANQDDFGVPQKLQTTYVPISLSAWQLNAKQI